MTFKTKSNHRSQEFTSDYFWNYHSAAIIVYSAVENNFKAWEKWTHQTKHGLTIVLVFIFLLNIREILFLRKVITRDWVHYCNLMLQISWIDNLEHQCRSQLFLKKFFMVKLQKSSILNCWNSYYLMLPALKFKNSSENDNFSWKYSCNSVNAKSHFGVKSSRLECSSAYSPDLCRIAIFECFLFLSWRFLKLKFHRCLFWIRIRITKEFINCQNGSVDCCLIRSANVEVPFPEE